MKYITIILTILLSRLLAMGQGNIKTAFFHAGSPSNSYYVAIGEEAARVYLMGRYLDKAGTGFAIRTSDTLVRQPDGTYMGNTSKIITDNDSYYLITASKKKKKLYTTNDADSINTRLNNAYYLDHYFHISEALNKSYPLYTHSFREGFAAWKLVENKGMDYLQFPAVADLLLRQLKDSISRVQDQYVTRTHYLLQNIHTIDYNTLKDTLTAIPAAYAYQSRYYGTIISEVSRQQPAYFFKLAEDFPQNRDLIFWSADRKTTAMQGLKAVAGHDVIKKEFFKGKK